MPEMNWTSPDAELTEAVLLRTLDLMPDGILLIDGMRTAAYANSAFLNMWGLSSDIVDEVKGADEGLLRRVIEQVREPGDFISEVERLYDSGESSRDEVALKGGRVFQRRSVPIELSGKGRVWVFTDITEERLSGTDPLTGLRNRRSYEREFPDFVKAHADDAWRGVTLMDIDNFKALNDTEGHARGDEVLRRVGAFLAEEVRGSDAAYRIGGEEFLITSRHRSGEGAADLAERLRGGLIAQRIEHKENGDLGVITVSIGVGAFNEPQDPDRLFESVDKALYRAKRAGRNRVEQAILAGKMASDEAEKSRIAAVQ